MDTYAPLPLALIRARRGMLSAIARELGVKPQTISSWRWIPAEHVVTVERVTGVPRYILCPELYEGLKLEHAPWDWNRWIAEGASPEPATHSGG